MENGPPLLILSQAKVIRKPSRAHASIRLPLHPSCHSNRTKGQQINQVSQKLSLSIQLS
jgi:hypothetical protein